MSKSTLILFIGLLIAFADAFTGEATWYTPGRGACGWSSTQDDYIVALAAEKFDHYRNQICGKNVRASYQGRSVVVKVVDRCGGCNGPDNMDMAPAAFRVLANQGAGRLYGVEWDWTNSEPGPVRSRRTLQENGTSTGHVSAARSRKAMQRHKLRQESESLLGARGTSEDENPTT